MTAASHATHAGSTVLARHLPIWLRTLAFLVIPTAAWANAGIPIGFESLTISTLWFLAVVALENMILRHDLKLPFWRSLRIITFANLLSTVVGALLDIATVFLPIAIDPSFRSRSIGVDLIIVVYFIPLFFLSWWIEGMFAARQLREIPRAKVWRSLLKANLCSYGLLTAFVLFRAFLRMT